MYKEYAMGKKLYIGNLSFNTTHSQIRELFSQAGEITEVNLITDRYTGTPKGFGFVEMATEEAAQEAIQRFNGYSLDNRALTVNEARPREEATGNPNRGNKRF
jgi:RNA recognition motif-containing protein